MFTSTPVRHASSGIGRAFGPLAAMSPTLLVILASALACYGGYFLPINLGNLGNPKST